MMKNDSQFDGVLGGVIERCGGIESFMDVLFDFLARRTDFYTPSLGNSKLAHDTLFKNFEKYKSVANSCYSDQVVQRKERDLQKKQREASEPVVIKKKEAKLHPQVEDITDVDIDNQKKGLAEPVSNGGITDRYTWTQSLPIVDVYINVPKGTPAKQCKVTIGQETFRVVVAGDVIIDGKLHDKVKSVDSMWTLEDQSVIHVVLEKQDIMKWWTCVIQGDPEIDTQKIVPENSKLSDLDPELRQTVEKMMFDQEQKAKGLPTSDQQKQTELLEKFKLAHPEMDFSKAKICNSNGFGGGQFQF